MSRIINDNRRIYEIHESGDHQTNAYAIGTHSVIAIEAYGEPGENVPIPFVQIHLSSGSIIRLAAKNLAIYYEPLHEDDE